MSLEQTNPSGQFVCPNCGWSVITIDVKHGYHDWKCHAAAGRLASELASLLPDIPSTKFGYGEGRLTFKISNDCHVRLQRRERDAPPPVRCSRVGSRCRSGSGSELNEWEQRRAVRSKVDRASGG